jgi:hypothetical protein
MQLVDVAQKRLPDGDGGFVGEDAVLGRDAFSVIVIQILGVFLEGYIGSLLLRNGYEHTALSQHIYELLQGPNLLCVSAHARVRGPINV